MKDFTDILVSSNLHDRILITRILKSRIPPQHQQEIAKVFNELKSKPIKKRPITTETDDPGYHVTSAVR